MTILRERDWFGKVIESTRPAPNLLETLINGLFSGSQIVVRVDSEDELSYFRGNRVIDRTSPILYPPQYVFEYKGFSLQREEINRYDIRSKRNWLGVRTSYRWKPSPEDLDLFIEAATGERPIFSK